MGIDRMKSLLTLICVISTIVLAALRGLYFLYTGVARTLLREVICLSEETCRNLPCQIFIQISSITPVALGMYFFYQTHNYIANDLEKNIALNQNLAISSLAGMASFFGATVSIFAIITLPVMFAKVVNEFASAASHQWKTCANKVESRLGA